jgi:hypothetical protein
MLRAYSPLFLLSELLSMDLDISVAQNTYQNRSIYIFISTQFILLSRDSVVDIATSHGLFNRGVGVRVPVRSRIFFSPRRPDRLWGPPNLLSNG